MTYSNLGWLNLIILGILITPYILRYLNKFIPLSSKAKKDYYLPSLKFFRKIHKPIGILLIIIPPIHGYMALGALRLHTGLVLYLSALATAILGGIFYKTKKKSLFKFHKIMALITILLFLLHFFVPNALYYLFK